MSTVNERKTALIHKLTNALEESRDVLSSVVNSDMTYLSNIGQSVTKPRQILVIGSGGTGSWFAPKLIKMLNDSLSKRLLPDASVLFVDADEIEEKNLIRQNFIPQDIGKNKALTLGSRYGSVCHPKLQVSSLGKYIVAKESDIHPDHKDKFTLLSSLGISSSTWIISLIDNAQTRKAIHMQAMRSRCYVIDVGNDARNGQLNFSNYNCRNQCSIFSSYYMQYPEAAAENDGISLFNCADADANSEDQLFNANDMAASVLANFLNSVIETRKVHSGKIEFVTGSNISVNRSIPLYEDVTRSYSGYDIHDAKRQYAGDVERGGNVPILGAILNAATPTTWRGMSSSGSECMTALKQLLI